MEHGHFVHEGSDIGHGKDTAKQASVGGVVGQGHEHPTIPLLLHSSYTTAGEFSSQQILPVKCALDGPHLVVAVGWGVCILIFQ